jgi:dolichol-phosphate mannosyltransferase
LNSRVTNAASPEISLVIPCFNEAANLRPLVEAIRATMEPLGRSYEIVVTDDCSRDNSWAVIRELAADPRVRGQRLERNCGQSAALWAGINAARGRIIVTMDADLQNDPRDLPALLDGLQHCDCVCGSRVASRAQGDNWVRIGSSRVANWVRNRLSGENISDAGCCYRAFKRECVAGLKFFRGMHRFLPTLFRMEGFTVMEVPISHHPRHAGQTNYGIGNRLLPSLYDLIAVRWMKKRMVRYQIADRVN